MQKRSRPGCAVLRDPVGMDLMVGVAAIID